LYVEFWWESQKEEDQQENLEVDARILGVILEEEVGVQWTAFMWLRTGTSDGLL
jgi:hypothetical protein